MHLEFGILNLFVICSLALGIFYAPQARALGLTPAVIDQKALPRDIIKDTVVLKNDASKKLSFYADVKNVDLKEGAQPFSPKTGEDLADSLANWIEFTRGVIDIEPGEEKEIPLRINVNMRAKPGLYHAQITFHQGWNQSNALGNAPDGQVAINIEVLDDAKVELQVKNFSAAKTFFLGFPISFGYAIENIGNRPIRPWGEIRIYDRRGKEMGAIPLAEEHEQIAPSASARLGSIWDGVAQSGLFGNFGHYKAVLDVRYGSKGQSLQDTAWVWVLPWWMLAVALGFFGMMSVWLRHRLRHPVVQFAASRDVSEADFAADSVHLHQIDSGVSDDFHRKHEGLPVKIESERSLEPAAASEESGISSYAYEMESPAIQESRETVHRAASRSVAHNVPIISPEEKMPPKQHHELSWDAGEDDWHISAHGADTRRLNADHRGKKHERTTRDLYRDHARTQAVPARHRKNPFHRSKHVVNLREE